MLSSRNLSQQARLNGQIHPPPYASTHQLDRAISSASAYHSSLNGPGQPKIDPGSHDEPSLKRRISEIDHHEGMNSSQSACTGGHPCDKCRESNFECKYARAHKKRGRAPKKDYAQDPLSASGTTETGSTASGPNGRASQETPSTDVDQTPMAPTSNSQHTFMNRNAGQSSNLPPMSVPGPVGQGFGNHPNSAIRSLSMSDGAAPAVVRQHSVYGAPPPGARGDVAMLNLNTMRSMDTTPGPGGHALTGSHMPGQSTQDYSMQQYYGGAQQTPAMSDARLDLLHLAEQEHAAAAARGLSGETPGVGYLGHSPDPTSPAWLTMPSPPLADPAAAAAQKSTDGLRYPVLRPLLPLIESIIPKPLACDLLDVYFTSSSSAQLRPASPHILGYVFRKKSLLHPTHPRTCSPALLASMLWIAAQTSNATFLSANSATRGRVCRMLLELTVNLLKPLIHTPVPGGSSLHGPTNHIIDDVSLGVLGVSTDHVGFEGSVTAQVDVLATYIHLATVVSASERKSASLRWWNAAWGLARELKFGREPPPNPPQHEASDYQSDATLSHADYDHEMREAMPHAPLGKGLAADPGRRPDFMTEEEREERRRIWWLVYMMDRHLALCYNRPLSLLDKECEGLLQPMDDSVWQSGTFPSADSTYATYRRRGPSIEYTGLSIFGYFLPLMTILGSIVDLNHARSRPNYGTNFPIPNRYDDHVQRITHQLELYGQSIQDLETQAATAAAHEMDSRHNEAATPSVRSASTTDSNLINELTFQRKTTIAYGTHIMHVLHILLAGKWDPITLLDDNDLWISSQSFITATDHAIAAAEAVSDITEYDPDLSFMPFFFGVYLLQGSFLLLLFADKLQGDVSPNVVKACETIIRAHEACVVTLDTQYQRNFRKVMRSALAQVRGRMAEDLAEQQHWRREVLSLYRWTGDGTGLAL